MSSSSQLLSSSCPLPATQCLSSRLDLGLELGHCFFLLQSRDGTRWDFQRIRGIFGRKQQNFNSMLRLVQCSMFVSACACLLVAQVTSHPCKQFWYNLDFLVFRFLLLYYNFLLCTNFIAIILEVSIKCEATSLGQFSKQLEVLNSGTWKLLICNSYS